MKSKGSTENLSQSQDSGFTLIEVGMATLFVGIIIALLSATTVNIVRSYNKGIWLAQINQAGQQLNMDIGEKARYSSAATVNEASRRLCVGGVSYLWNTVEDLQADDNPNTYTNGQEFSLVRIEDPSGEYCADGSKKPVMNGSGVQTVLGRGAAIQRFDVEQGVGGNDSIPLLSLSTVISTEGSNQPVLSYLASDGTTKIDVDGDNANSHWQCGDWYDTGTVAGVVDNDDKFVPAANQYCSFAEYNITVYERSK